MSEIKFDMRAFVSNELARQYFAERYGEDFDGHPGDDRLVDFEVEVDDALAEELRARLKPHGITVQDFMLVAVRLFNRRIAEGGVDSENAEEAIEELASSMDLALLGDIRRAIVAQLYSQASELRDEYETEAASAGAKDDPEQSA